MREVIKKNQVEIVNTESIIVEIKNRINKINNLRNYFQLKKRFFCWTMRLKTLRK